MIVPHAKFKKMCMNVCISNLACIRLFNYRLKKSFHLNVQDIIINLKRLIEQCFIVNCVICVYGIVYEMLNAIFQICSLTVAHV